MSDTCIVFNNRPTLIELPAIKPKVSNGTEVVTEAVLDVDNRIVRHPVFMEAGLVLVEGHPLQKLLPGENTVDTDYWARMCQLRSVKTFVACGYLKNLGEGEATQLIAALDTLTPEMARARILECTSVMVLQGWAEGTESRSLHGLITERVDTLIAGATGAPIRGGQIRDQKPEDRSFGDSTTAVQADGRGGPLLGEGEQTAPSRVGAPPAPAAPQAPTPVPPAPPAPTPPAPAPPAPTPPAPAAPAPAPAQEGSED